MIPWIGNETVFITCFLFSLFTGLLSDMTLKHILKLDKLPQSAFINAAGTAVFIGIHGFTGLSLMCAIIFQILLFASVYDMNTHTIPDYVHILILTAGLLRFQPLPSFLGLIIVPLPFLAAALRKKNSIGGGDIKLMGACGFVLGIKAGFAAIAAALALAALINTVYNKEKRPFALVPYLSFGCFMALLQI